MLPQNELHDFLETKYKQYNRVDFISSDPISIPHLFTKKEDIEIAGFLSATIAWGQRVTIINNGKRLMKMMGNRILKMIALGLANIALKLALVIAHKALDWL